MDLPCVSVAGGDPAGDLPQGHGLALARPLGNAQFGGGVGQVVLVIPAPVISALDGGELRGGQVRGCSLRQVSRSKPASRMSANSAGDQPPRVEAHRHPPALTSDLPQVREQAAQLAGQGVRRLGDHHEHRIPVLIGHPGLLGGGSGELQPRDVSFLDLPGAEVGAGVPVGIKEPERVRAGGGVPAGQGHDQLMRLAGRCQLGELAADGLDLRRPVQAEHPAQRARRHPGRALGPGLPGQGQEHQGQQRRGQAVVAVPQPAVDVPGAIQEAGAFQRRQHEQQPGQRIPRAGREHRAGALAEQAPPGQRPLPSRGTGSGSTGISSSWSRGPGPGAARPASAPSPALVLAGSPARGAGTRPSALRTVNVDTPVAAATCRSVCPAASSSPIRAVSSAVSFDGPFGPGRAGTSPATAPPASA